MGGFTIQGILKIEGLKSQGYVLNTGMELSRTEILHSEKIIVRCTEYNLVIILTLFKHWE